jgi:hypothetical protein
LYSAPSELVRVRDRDRDRDRDGDRVVLGRV